MKTKPTPNFGCLLALSVALLAAPGLKADVVVLQSGSVITGTILQQDAGGVLLQMEYGTFRYPLNLIREVRKEPATAPHVSNNGQVIPDWAQIVSLLANTGWADNLQQVPAPVISYGMFNNIPYISFRCAEGGYEVNIYGDLNHPAAVQAGAMGYNSGSAAARSNCVNFVCSLLASADARAVVRSLNLDQKTVLQNGGMTFETIVPGEWGSYGGWWVLVYNQNSLASAQASEAELTALAQPRTAAAVPPPEAPAQPAATATSTTYNNYYGGYGYGTTYYVATGWTRDEINNARPATLPANYPAASAANRDYYHPATSGMVYPRTYTRTAEPYGNVYRRR